MGAFIARQPNGLLCRFSSIVDTITSYNMTEEEYINECALKGINEARETIERRIKPFSWVKDSFIPNNMSQEEFDKLIEEMSTPVENPVKESTCDDEKIAVECVSPVYSQIPVTIPNTMGIPESDDISGEICNGDGRVIGYLDWADSKAIYGVIYNQCDLYVGNTDFYITVKNK